MINPAIASFSSSEWTAIGIPLANHLWQSTLFAAIAGVATLLLRKNRAQVRYWLWLAASLKFLIPFSLLIAAGARLAPAKAPPMVQPTVTVVVQEISQPFATAMPPSVPPVTRAPRLVPILLLAAWFSGWAGVLLLWCLRWRRITRIARSASQLASGREIEIQRRLQRSVGTSREVNIISSTSALEPGVIGIFRPVLVLPAGISDRLTDIQLEAIIAHELCHVRRRDNLAAAIHMLVEAVFWFHPLVWWIGARLVDERERACDEEVVRLGSEPQAYAEGILKVCQFYLESPLVCVAGVTGSNLKKRIEDIMSQRIAHNLNLAKKLLLATMGLAALIVPVAIGILNPTSGRAQSQAEAAVSPVFTNISIKLHQPETDPTKARPTAMLIRKPGSPDFTAVNLNLKDLVASAYDLKPQQISGGPDWLTTETYDIDAKVEETGTFDQVRTKLQNLLADRFKLKFHRETKEEPVYELVVGMNGSKLKEVPPSELSTPRPPAHLTPGGLDVKQATMRQLAAFLSNSTGRMVIDKSGLRGVYDFTLDWTRGDSNSVIKAVHEQLGLDLKPQTAPIENLIIDSAEKPTADLAQASAPPSQRNDAAEPAFANVSIKPSTAEQKGWWSHSYPDGRFVARNASLKAFIQTAYGINVVSIPDTLTSERYDIDANAAGPAQQDQLLLMLRTLLTTRFKVVSHVATKEMPVYVLSVGTQGPKLRLVDPAADKCELTIKAPGGEAHIVGNGTTLCLAKVLTYLSQENPPFLDRPVLDNTGIKGVFDFDVAVDLGNPSSFVPAMQQLGLKLEANTAPMEILVVDSAEQISRLDRQGNVAAD